MYSPNPTPAQPPENMGMLTFSIFRHLIVQKDRLFCFTPVYGHKISAEAVLSEFMSSKKRAKKKKHEHLESNTSKQK